MKFTVCVRCNSEIEYVTKKPKQCFLCRKISKAKYEKQWSSENRHKTREATSKNQLKKRKLVDQHKLDRGCQDCGYKEHAFVLQFDHVRGEKLFTIGTSIGSHSLQDLIDEISKCDVVCANCHAIRTWNRGQRFVRKNSTKDSSLQNSEEG